MQLAAIAVAAQAGCQLIQIRERDLDSRSLSAFAREAIDRAHPHGARVLINDRLDIALAVNADGVHLRTTSLSAAQVRELAKQFGREDVLIGASVHTLAEAQMAAQSADFIVCGPVYDTPSKRPYGPPLGLTGLAKIACAVDIPTLAIGGIKIENFRESLQCGAAGIAAIGLFTDLTTLRRHIRTILATSISNG